MLALGITTGKYKDIAESKAGECVPPRYLFGDLMNIYDLRTQGETLPLGIDTTRPVFSWKLAGESGTFQHSYRIKVASEKELLLGVADMWDSGVVQADESLCVVYAGKPLQERKAYFWSVEVNGACVASSRFETAYLGKAMPHARYVGMPLAYHGGSDVLRLDFQVTEKPERVRLYLAALGCYRVYLNGKAVNRDYFDGALSQYDKRVFYRTFALEDVQIGANALCVEIGYGFYGAKKCKAELYLEYADGTTQVYPTVAGRVWNVTQGRIKENSIYGGEVCDGRVSSDIYLPSCPPDTSLWVAAYCVDPPAGELRACPIPAMRVAESFAPVSIRQKENRLLVDAGKNICGWLRIRVRGERGAKVNIRYCELVNKDGTLNRANLRTADSRNLYILSGKGEETYAPSFTYHGFRYAEIVCEGKVQTLDMQVERICTALDSGGSFTTSDKTLQALHDMAVLTEANNLNGVFTDCPQRDERLGWLNDMSSRVFESVCNFDMRNFLPNFIDMITDSQDESGAFGDTVPYAVGSPIADSVDAYPVLGWIAYKMYGDADVLRRNYQGFCKWNKKLSQYEKNGIMEWEIYGDWCPAFAFSRGGDGTHSAQVAEKFMGAASYLWNLKLTAQIAEVIGKADEAAAWRSAFEQRKKAFFARYLAENGVLGKGSQTEYAVGLTVFPEEDELCAKWAAYAADDIVQRGYHTTCGNLGYRHLFYRLSEAGYADILCKLLTNPEYPGWGYMLACGATTVWERWEADVGTDMHSFNHPMFAAYDGFLFNYIAGIRTEECSGAFKEILIQPCFVRGLPDAEGILHTVRGDIRAAWRRENERIKLELSIPAGSRCTVRVPGKKIILHASEFADELQLTNGDFTLYIC